MRRLFIEHQRVLDESGVSFRPSVHTRYNSELSNRFNIRYVLGNLVFIQVPWVPSTDS